MNPFSWLFLGHFVGDFLLQNRWMALHKPNNYKALITHAAVYTLAIYLFSLPFGRLSLFSVLFVFISHIVLDKQLFINWWTEHITKSSDRWLKVVIDQTFHFLVIGVVIIIQ